MDFGDVKAGLLVIGIIGVLAGIVYVIISVAKFVRGY